MGRKGAIRGYREVLMNGVVGLQALGLSVESLSSEALFGIDTGTESRHLDGFWKLESIQ